jgi:hypothetical protein
MPCATAACCFDCGCALTGRFLPLALAVDAAAGVRFADFAVFFRAAFFLLDFAIVNSLVLAEIPPQSRCKGAYLCPRRLFARAGFFLDEACFFLDGARFFLDEARFLLDGARFFLDGACFFLAGAFFALADALALFFGAAALGLAMRSRKL